MGEAKPWYQSRTILMNLTALAVWILTLAVNAAQAGELPAELSPYAMLVVLVGNVLLRLITTQPVIPPVVGRQLPSLLLLAFCPLAIASAAPPVPVLKLIVNDEAYELPEHDTPIRVIAGDKVVYDLSASEGADRYFVMLDNHRPGQKEISTRDKWQHTEQRTRAGEYQLRFIVSNPEATVELKRVVQVLCKEPALPDEPDPPSPQPIPPKPVPPTPVPPPGPAPLPPGEFSISEKVAAIVRKINSPQRASEAAQLADAAEALAAQIAAGTVQNATEVLTCIGAGIKALNSPPWTTAAAEFAALMEATWKAHSSGRLKLSTIGGLQDPAGWATLLREIALGVRSVK